MYISDNYKKVKDALEAKRLAEVREAEEHHEELREKFPEIRTSCELAGYLSEEAAGCLGLRAGIPVSVGGGDGACANIGAGVA